MEIEATIEKEILGLTKSIAVSRKIVGCTIRNENVTMSIPEPNSYYLKIIVEALKKRSKAIKHSVVSYLYSMEIDNIHGQSYERFNMDFELAKMCSSIRISFWEDRWFFICVRQKLSNGKYFNCIIEGRVGEVNGPEIIKKLEETIKTSSHSEGSELDESMKRVWDSIVLTGPRILDQ